ncbi:MAG: large-conductance mechanosensitive channel protein MscL [Bacteroidales bacterium]|uniref:large-conductance mechanosensitive channel protein MscL n=1 Tax=Porphyromonas sp. TaxID=1924944 RepID=UPI00297B7706|nr:large-conductance mechanosensitive channel protein MscL [Porphyromonas sp.]MDD7437576.1 large-conductance mechanosensitive channel protein MscL [Bacteroidales bacterium]MDY3067654.1 large-conductance mechanosensitive channel protein MscL [Porphyromonas sp.]
MAIVKEFKEFVNRGNVVDMAVGVVIGGAFGKIVASFVNDVLMPPLGLLLGGMDFKELKWIMQPGTLDEAGQMVGEVALNYGMFIQSVIDFFIIAFAIFMLIKGMNKLKREKPAEPEAPAPKAEDVVLLEEIRDLLKNK